MSTVTPDQLRAAIEAQFPRNATCWSQATDEVRDMARAARLILNRAEVREVMFRTITSPALWNQRGTDAIVYMYGLMDQDQKSWFLDEARSFIRV